MPRTMVIEKVVFKLEELDEATQQKAHDRWCEHNLSYDWWEYVYEQAVQVGAMLGIEIDTRPTKLMGGGTGKGYCIGFSGFSSQGDGAHFEGNYSYARGSLAKIMAGYPTDTELQSIARSLQSTQKRHLYNLRARVKHRGHYSHSGCTSIEVEHTKDRYRDIGDAEDDIASALRSFMDWIYDCLEKEHDYLQSFEQFKESAEANEYEFDESGRKA